MQPHTSGTLGPEAALVLGRFVLAHPCTALRSLSQDEFGDTSLSWVWGARFGEVAPSHDRGGTAARLAHVVFTWFRFLRTRPVRRPVLPLTCLSADRAVGSRSVACSGSH